MSLNAIRWFLEEFQMDESKWESDDENVIPNLEPPVPSVSIPLSQIRICTATTQEGIEEFIRKNNEREEKKKNGQVYSDDEQA